jgi:fructose-1,6-bisphosphatase-3
MNGEDKTAGTIFAPTNISVSTSPDKDELTLLRALAANYSSAESALAEVSALRAGLHLPLGVVHVISDVHGEYKKLRHVINNASGSLRPLVESLFGERLTDVEIKELLAVLYYPREMMAHMSDEFADSGSRRKWVSRTLRLQFELVRGLAKNYRRAHVVNLFPPERRELFEELLAEPCSERAPAYVDEMIYVLTEHDQDLLCVRAASRLVRNLTASEIIVAGDLGDRGPRIDRVIDYLMEQPNVTFTWGNHDAEWMGACLGQEALIATVLRISLRYRRLSQLEEGYGLIVSPLEKLARTIYADDPAECFELKGTGLRDDALMRRMQKAAAIMQFKLEGQTIRRHPEWDMENRNLLHRIDFANGTVEIDGQTFPLRDTHLPTIDPNDPYKLSAEESACMNRLRQSFLTSARLWEHMRYVAKRGAMWVERDDALIFHACVPVDEGGQMLSLKVDGEECAGRALFDSLGAVIRRAFRAGAATGAAAEGDADWFWYLWAGARSPFFGKDRMATFETYFVEDKQTQVENKNPYFDLMHDADFCRRIMREFGVTEDGLIVNGHVPVKIEKGEQPVKRGGNAVTIDGAFSEAYGDHGYTLILAPESIALAEHHHFGSIEDAITSGADIVPKVTIIRTYDHARIIADTDAGAGLRRQCEALERLIAAYEHGTLIEPA